MTFIKGISKEQTWLMRLPLPSFTEETVHKVFKLELVPKSPEGLMVKQSAGSQAPNFSFSNSGMKPEDLHF